MCVTNTTSRRLQAVSFPIEQVATDAAGCPSLLSQRLMGNFALPEDAAVPRAADAAGYDALFQSATGRMPAPRPKRRRKPQKPGKTAKMNDRHFVEHNYHDHARDLDQDDSGSSSMNADLSEEHRRRGGVAVAFPERLHEVLQQVEADGYASVISWQPHGRCFVVHKPKEFVEHIMPHYFRQTKLTSFQRQLNLYGFNRLTRGPDAGGYYHELFLRNREFLCKRMVRTKVKGTKFKAASSPEQEPDFYRMPPVSYVTPNHSDEDSASQDSSQLAVAPAKPLSMPSQAFPLQALCYSAQTLPVTSSGLYAAAPVSGHLLSHLALAPAQLQADAVLDQAVDELFLGEFAANEVDNLADFVNEWCDASGAGPFGGAAPADDIQLGFMLEKLLED